MTPASKRGRKARTDEPTLAQKHRLQVIANNSELDLDVAIDATGLVVASCPHEYIVIIDRQGNPLTDVCYQPHSEEWVWTTMSWADAPGHSVIMHLGAILPNEQAADELLREYVTQPLEILPDAKPARYRQPSEPDRYDELLA